MSENLIDAIRVNFTAKAAGALGVCEAEAGAWFDRYLAENCHRAGVLFPPGSVATGGGANLVKRLFAESVGCGQVDARCGNPRQGDLASR